MYFHNPDDRQKRPLAPGIQIRTFWGENLLISVVDFQANAVVPAHSHSQEQIIYLLEGDLEVVIAGETHPMRSGELIIVPGGAEHSARVGPQSARGIDVFSPVREDLKY